MDTVWADAQAGGPPAQVWLWTDELDEDSVVVTAVGGIASVRADVLWSELEGAAEVAAGRVVVADLTRVTTFDGASIQALAKFAGACRRRHVSLSVIVQQHGPLSQYVEAGGLTRQLPTCVAMATPASPTIRHSPQREAALLIAEPRRSTVCA